ncbi:MAG: hypothetical protein H7Z77_11070 [Chitinophagaceae bacterium]|nr:hypothetical protein [Polaromonas sp.]
MHRRHLLQTAASTATSAAVFSLPGCGFALRTAPTFVFKSIYSPFPESSPLGAEFKRTMESNGAVRVISDARELAQAEVVLDVLAERREKIVVSRNAAGQVREFQLRLFFKFNLRTAKGKELITEAELLQQRDISFNESAVLAKEAEEGLLYRDMQSDIVQQLMRRLAALRTL